jgi:hypothetical protein
MAKIEQITRNTGKKCDCAKKGKIVETFKKVYGKSNGILGSGHFTPSKVVSVSIACEECKRTYAFPSLLDTHPDIQGELNFELSLGVGIVKKLITLEDLPMIAYYKQRKMKPYVFHDGSTAPQHSLTPAVKKPKRVPKELKKLSIGTTVYFTPKSSEEIYHNPHNRFATIQLTKEQRAKTFEVHYHCFE